ncbi:hypothetical protein [Nitrolancea hollandica]|uniref:Uncharacterized protein n=1 Tax=Nitrolancea hollandica Lb TaxID=1129897 RepID=I4EM26_9BACT|nr:hypothetical protein [Nitrolancea hollandica]CCF85739.1 hypothetical protein NITHO_5550002 [Nitrolancea hollandica Lb]
MNGIGSVQATHVDLAAIEDDVVRLAGGQARAVLEVGSRNFGLQGEAEQDALIAGFAAFLNSLSVPVQILVRVLPVDLAGSLQALERRKPDLPAALAELADDHLAFLRTLARRRTLLERRFYLVVPAEVDSPRTNRWRLPWPGPRKLTEPDADVCHRLSTRCDAVQRELGRCGLTVRRLGNAELVHLFVACWSPERARLRRLKHDLTASAGLVVQAQRNVERRS